MKKLKIALLRFEDGVPQVKIVKKVASNIQLTIFGMFRKILVLWSKWNVLVIVLWVLD